MHVNANLQCQSNTAVVTWQQSSDVLYYLVRGTLSTGEAATACNSTTDVCKMSALKCGEEYAFTVTAYGKQCNSNISSAVYITTGKGLTSPSNVICII